MKEHSLEQKENNLGFFLFYIVLAVVLVCIPAIALATTVGTNVSVSGTLTVSGNTTLGNATSTDIIYVNSYFASSLIPTANNSEDLGIYGNAWNNIFASGTSYLAHVSSTGAITVGANITSDTNNTDDLGAYGLAWKDAYVSGTLYLGEDAFPSYTGIELAGNGSLNIGAYGNALGTLYASSTVYAGGLKPGSAGNNNDDIGVFGEAFANVYTSGTLRTATTSIINSESTSTLFIKTNTSGNQGGRIVFEQPDGTCVEFYIGNDNSTVHTESVDCGLTDD